MPATTEQYEVSRTSGARWRLVPAMLGCVAVVTGLGAGMIALQGPLAGRAVTSAWLDPETWFGKLLGDLTEAQFYATIPAGIGLVVMAVVAHRLARARHRLRGFDISYGTGLLPWVLTAATAGLLLSHALWGWTRGEAWQPTFVAFVSVPPAIVLVYGAGWRVALTGGVLGALLTAPLALAAVNLVCRPLDLPNVVGNVTGMWSSALIAFLLCRWLPWMRRPAPDPAPAAPTPVPGSSWLPRRVLADFTEAQFFGNEWASLGMLAGLVLAWALNPGLPGYASNLVPQMLTAQLLTAVLGVWWHADRWRRHGWYPTFVPVVSLAPAAVLVHGGGWAVIVAAALIGALLGPPLAYAVISRLPADFHPFIGSVFSMTVTTLVGVGLIGVPQLF